MNTYKLTIAYDGTHYAGWQRLTDKKTLQGKIEETLTRLLGETIEVVGAGRTDSGVHAMGQVASFSANTEISPLQLMQDLNHYLPSDIRIVNAERVQGRFHARHQAQQKHYRYLIQQNMVLPFERDYCILAPGPLALEAMNQAAQVFVGEHDFTAFSNVKIGKKSAIKRIDGIQIHEEDGQITFDFFGSGFLYHMVRKLMSALIAVGMGELTVDDMQRILNSKDRSAVPGLAPAKGLFLVQVMYTEQER